MNICLLRHAVLAFALLALAACDGEKGAGVAEPNHTPDSPGAQTPGVNTAPAKWKTLQKLGYDWAGDGSKYEFTLSIPEGWSDAGDFTRLEIAHNGKVVYALTDESGLDRFAGNIGDGLKRSAKMNLLASPYLLMLPAQGKSGSPVLFVFGWAYASSPGSLRVIALDKGGVPQEALSLDNFWLTAFTDLNHDGHMDVIGKQCFSQGFGPDLLTYDPFTVYRSGEAPSSPMTADLALSEAYNKKEYYGWAGPDCREDVAVVMHPPGGGKPVVMDVKAAEKLFEKK